MGPDNRQPFLMDVPIEVDRLGISARAGQQYDSPAESRQVKGRGNGFGMAGCIDDQRRVLTAALRTQGRPQLTVRRQRGVDAKRLCKLKTARIFVYGDHRQPAIETGVLFEAVYATLRVRPVVRKNLLSAIPGDPPLTWIRFLRFYLPLVLTTFMQILLQPLVSASLSRMPDSLSSLALWPVLYGVLLMTNSAAYAFVESVIVLLDRPGSIEPLRRFTWRLGLSLAAIPLALAVTPLGDLWFYRIAALPPELLHQARLSLWLVIPLPALTALSSLFQGTLINSQRTRRITEADALSLALVTALLALGSLLGGRPCGESGAILCGVPGVFIAVAAFNFGSVVRNFWLWRRSQRIYLSIRLRHARA